MGGIALLARELGYHVQGMDQQLYPPMSTQLSEQGIPLHEGYDPAPLAGFKGTVIIGNALTRGNPAVECTLAHGLPYTSGPQWLGEAVLHQRWVLAVAGTHGKTTTASLLAWILDYAGLKPGFLIGGIPLNFGLSARLGQSRYFVIEADEYDTAFFDKRSKFVHYRPKTAILNNLEYDHADIFPDLAAIQRQFHHLIRTVPANGCLILPDNDPALAETLRMGCWSPVEYTGPTGRWQAIPLTPDGSSFALHQDGRAVGSIHWSLLGAHNLANALAAIAAAAQVGVAPSTALAALPHFRSIRRRLEIRGVVGGVTVYDDFAHHPTAIATTLAGLRARVGPGVRIHAVLEPRSNTMKLGVHQQTLAPAFAAADQVTLFQPTGLGWDLSQVTAQLAGRGMVCTQMERLVDYLTLQTQPGDHVVIMSNGGFGGLHQRLLEALHQRFAGAA